MSIIPYAPICTPSQNDFGRWLPHTFPMLQGMVKLPCRLFVWGAYFSRLPIKYAPYAPHAPQPKMTLGGSFHLPVVFLCLSYVARHGKTALNGFFSGVRTLVDYLLKYAPYAPHAPQLKISLKEF